MASESPKPLHPLARAGRNLLAKSAGELGARVLFLLLFIYAARVLGAGDYGRYSYAASLAALALIGMDLGLNTLLVRDGARRRHEAGAYAGTILAIKAVLALSVLAIIALFCLGRGFASDQVALVLAVALGQVLWGLSEAGVAGLNALERMDLEAVVKTSGRLAALLLAGGLLVAGWGLWGLVGGLILANGLAAALALTMLARKAPFRLRRLSGFLAYLARQCLPLALTSVFLLVYLRVDMVMLEMMGRPYDEIGWYAAGVRILDAVGVVPGMVAGAILPVLSSLAASDRPAVERLFSQAQRLLVMLGLPAAVGLFMVRGEVAMVIYGPEFGPTGLALAWLAPAMAFVFVNLLQLNALIALGRQRLCALGTGLCVVVNVGLNLGLIPAHGMAGAAAATLITEVVLFILCQVFLYRALGPAALALGCLRPALATAVMGLALIWLRQWGLTVGIIGGAAVYSGALLALGGIRPDELGLLWRLARRPGEYAGGRG